MFKHYVTIALRHLKRHPGYTIINVSGLAVAIGCALLALLFVRYETGFDRFHTNSDRLVRAWVEEDHGEDMQFVNTVVPIPLGPTLADNFDAIEAAVRIDTFNDLVRNGSNAFDERVHFVDPAFFDAFSFDLIDGDASQALREPNHVVLTPAMAEKYFGDEDPMGQTLEVRVAEAFRTFTVVGVIEEAPRSSSIRYDLLLPYQTISDQLYSPRAQQSWYNVFGETYFLLRPGTDPAALQARFVPFMQQLMGDNYPQNHYHVNLQPIEAIHLDDSLPAGIQPISNPQYVYILGGIALLLILVASINFVTLAVGRSVVRAREVGVRKAVGAARRQLMQQFWGEALVTTLLAAGLGLALAAIVLPLFNTLAGLDLVLSLDAAVVLVLFMLVLLIGVGAGGYPAVVLSGFRPVEVLKGKVSMRSDRGLLRQGLVVVQFSLAIVMIVGTLVMARQLHFLQTKNLGFDQEHVVIVPTTGSMEEGMRVAQVFTDEVEGAAGVAAASFASYVPGGGRMRVGYMDDNGAFRQFNLNVVAPDFLETLGMQLVAGRGFSESNPTDRTRSLIVNQAFVQEYGWANALGQRLPGPDFGDHEVIGVVEDFHYESLRDDVLPLALVLDFDVLRAGINDMTMSASPRPDIAVRLRAGDVPAALAELERTWEALVPGEAFAYRFLDDALDAQYRQERRIGQIVQAATALAIFIACLGLFGLATLMVTRRTKEVGIRKVLGASVPGLLGLIWKDFAVLVGVAFVVAVPASYLLMQRWLADFAYRIEMGPGLFALAGAAALLIALATVSYHAVRAANANPVEALRYE